MRVLINSNYWQNSLPKKDKITFLVYIYDFESLRSMQEKMQDREFWKYYREMKRESPNCDTVQEVQDFFKKKGECERNSINYRCR